MRKTRTSSAAAVALLFFAGLCAAPARAQTSAEQNARTRQSIEEILNPNPLSGSIPGEKLKPGVIKVSLQDAINLALRYNLGLTQSSSGVELARAEQLRQLANLLPQVSAQVQESAEQINLAALGFRATVPGVPKIVGPFGVFNAQANLSQSLFNYNLIEKARATREETKSSLQALRNTRELVVLATGNAYLQVTTGLSRVEAAQAQVESAQALYNRAEDIARAGLSARIDPLRAKVELQTRQQQLITAQNDLDKSKLTLARTIGLPLAQSFQLSDRVPFQPIPEIDLEGALQRAYQRRPDYLQAQAAVKAAELRKSAAFAEHYPSLGIGGFYGDQGLTPGNSHGVFNATATLTIPIYAGGKTQADIAEADANLRDRRAIADDLHSRIEYEVRTAYLDVKAAAKNVEVAQTTLQLANETLTQAQDRFSAGVADNLEVVQAQESIATANESYISAVYQHNISKVILARSLGEAEQAVEEYLRGR